MRIARKEFLHPSGEFRKNLWWWFGCDKPEKEWYAKSLSEVRTEFMEFVNLQGLDRVVSINEYTTQKKKCGDDGVTHFVVWYWEDELPGEPTT